MSPAKQHGNVSVIEDRLSGGVLHSWLTLENLEVWLFLIPGGKSREQWAAPLWALGTGLLEVIQPSSSFRGDRITRPGQTGEVTMQW
jgi:hypothetical protein